MKLINQKIGMTLLLLSFCLTAICSGDDSKDKIKSAHQGYNCLFLGHSFFAPIARDFAKHPSRAGYSKHKQAIVFHGGSKGSPGKMWSSKKKDIAKAKKSLATGRVDLLGLTHFTGVGSDISDYRKWVDLALKHNSKTRFVIQAPWSKYFNQTHKDHEARSEVGLKLVHKVIDELRKAYPDSSFVCIPQGRWMSRLWKMYESGELSEITKVKLSNRKEKGSCLFLDNTGHGGDIPIKMGALLWLAVIYKVDLNQYKWETNLKTDLKKIAQEVVDQDPYCGLK